MNWSSLLDCTKTGPRSTLANAVTVLQKDPLWSPAVFWYDEFLDRVLIADTPTREWRDDDDTRLTIYLQHEIKMVSISEAQAASAVRYVARQRARHCVREAFAATPWDDVERIAHAFEDLWGVECTGEQPSDYVRAVSTVFFLGIVARVIHPGCQVDTMVIFEGPQGIGKSRALRILGGAWYMLAAESVTNKDFFQGLPGKLIVEIGEMDAFSRAERERVKTAISTPIDRYRSSYGRRAADHPRQCIFAGTTNRDDYVNDDSGARRFLPIRCGLIRADLLETARAQLFAEAYAKVQAGADWWSTPIPATLAAQRDRQIDDAWTVTVLDWVMGRQDVTSTEILIGALKFKESEIGRFEQLRVSGILKLAGWSRRTIRRNSRPIKAFLAPSVSDVGDVTIL